MTDDKEIVLEGSPHWRMEWRGKILQGAVVSQRWGKYEAPGNQPAN